MIDLLIFIVGAGIASKAVEKFKGTGNLNADQFRNKTRGVKNYG